jgi:hypothetical protein
MRPDTIETNMNAEREQLKKQYGSLFETVTALFFQSDPTGINFSDNSDEYDPETGTILPRLAGAKSAPDVQTIVHDSADGSIRRVPDRVMLTGRSL